MLALVFLYFVLLYAGFCFPSNSQEIGLKERPETTYFRVGHRPKAIIIHLYCLSVRQLLQFGPLDWPTPSRDMPSFTAGSLRELRLCK